MMFRSLTLHTLSALLACAALAACAAPREEGATPPFAEICVADDGYVATTWGWSICIEGHEMAWREDPEKWEADRKSPPDPVRMRALPPDKIPFSSHREDPEKWRADWLSPPGPARMLILPPDKIPYDSYRKRVVPPPPDPVPPDPPATD